MNLTSSINPILAALFGLTLFSLGFFNDSISFKFLIFSTFVSIGIFLLSIPMNWAIYILFFYLGIEGFAKMMTQYHPIIHVGADILIVTLWIRILITQIIQRKGLPTTYPPLTFLFFIHFLWFTVTLANPYSLSLFASLAGAKLYLTIVSLFFFGYYLSSDLKTVESFMTPWLMICVLQVATSLYQAAIGPSSVLSLSPTYAFALKKFEGYAFRPFGLTSQAGGPSVFLYLCTPFMVYFLFYSRSLLTKLAIPLLLFTSTLTVFVCQVRSSLLKTILGGAGVFFFATRNLQTLSQKTRKGTFLAIGIATIGIILIGPYWIDKILDANPDNQRAFDRSLSLFEYKNVSQARSGALDRFLKYTELVPLGAGLSRMGSASGKFQELIAANHYFSNTFFSDNLWIELLVDLGLPGLIIFTLILISIIIKAFMGFLKIQNPEFKAVQWTLICALGAILIGAYGAEPILYNPEGAFFWFFSGVALRIPTLDQV